ncbi:MAG: M48 family metalloprotease [Candidatus Hydrothermales bacterium]
MTRLFALFENYPELKANENVLKLQEELIHTKNRIAFERQHFNDSVMIYNTEIQVFPLVTKIPLFTTIAFLFSTLNSFISYKFGDSIILKVAGTREPNPSDLKEKTLLNVVEEMKIASGLPIPKVYIIDIEIPNAFATGKNPENSSIVVTRGLLELLNREELQGVIGHKISHIRNRDVLVMTVAATLVGAIVLLSDLSYRLPTSNLFKMSKISRARVIRSKRVPILIPLIIVLLFILSILGPLFARLTFFAISRSREYLADASSAELTRNPLSLAKALEKNFIPSDT